MPPGSASPKVRFAAAAAAFAALYFLAAELTSSLVDDAGIAVLWPASGVYLGVMLVAPRQLWGALALGAGLGSLAAYSHAGSSLELSVAFAVPSSAEGLLAAVLVERLARGRFTLGGLHDVSALAIGGLVATALVALSAGAVAAQTFDASFADSWLRWWSADALGILAIAPLVIALVDYGRNRPGAAELRYSVVVVAAVAVAAFSSPSATAAMAGGALALPVLLWAGGRWGPRAAALGGAGVALAAMHLASDGSGLLGDSRSLESGVHILQAFLAALLLSALAFAGAVADWRRERVVATRSRSRLRQVMDSSTDAYLAVDGQGRIADWSRSAEALLGWTADEAMGRSLDERVGPGVGPATPTPAARELMVRARHRTGQHFPVAVTMRPGDDDGLCHVFVRDLTESERLGTQLDRANEELERRRAARDEARSELRGTSEQLARAGRRIEQLEGDVSARDAELRETRSAVTAATRELDQVSRQHSAAAAARDQAKSEAERAGHEADRLRADLARASGELTRVRTELSTAAGDLSRAKATARAQEEKLESAQADRSAVAEALERASADAKHAHAEHARLAEEADRLRAAHEQATDELEQVRGAHEHAINELEELRGAHEHAINELEQLRGAHEHAIDELEQVRGAHENVAAELDHVRGAHGRAVGELEQLRDEHARVVDEAEWARAEHAQMAAAGAASSDELAAAERGRRLAEHALGEAREQLAEERERLQRAVEEARGGSAGERERVERALDDLGERFAEERERLQRALDESRAALAGADAERRLLGEHGTELISRYDARGVCLYASPASRVLLGYEPDELVGRPGADLIHPDDRARLLRARAAGTEATFEARLRRSDGEYARFEVTFQPDGARADGRLGEVTTTVRALGERAHDEGRRIAETRFNSLFGTLPTASALIGQDGRIRRANLALSRLTGYSRDQLEGTALGTLVDDEEAAIFTGRLHQISSGQVAALRLEQHLGRATGGTVPVELGITPLPAGENGGGSRLHDLVVHVVDLSDRAGAHDAEHRFSSSQTAA